MQFDGEGLQYSTSCTVFRAKEQETRNTLIFDLLTSNMNMNKNASYKIFYYIHFITAFISVPML